MFLGIDIGTSGVKAVLIDEGGSVAAHASAPLTASELVARGKVYFDAMRNPESAADFAAALTRPDITADDLNARSLQAARR